MKRMTKMPTYEYECPRCGTRHELKKQVIDRDNPVRCGCVNPPVEMIRTMTTAPGAIVKNPDRPGRGQR